MNPGKKESYFEIGDPELLDGNRSRSDPAPPGTWITRHAHRLKRYRLDLHWNATAWIPTAQGTLSPAFGTQSPAHGIRYEGGKNPPAGA